MRRISGEQTVDESFRSVVFWFTDDTFDEIKRQAQATDEASQAGNAWREFRSRARHRTETPRSMLEYMLQDEDIKNYEAEILGETLQSEGSGIVSRLDPRQQAFRFALDSSMPGARCPIMPSPEEVALINFDPGGTQDGIWYLTHFAEEWKIRHRLAPRRIATPSQPNTIASRPPSARTTICRPPACCN